MTTFKGKKIFRPRGQYQDHPTEDWNATARRAVEGGGRVVRSNTGEMHLVSPSDAHWGTFNPTSGGFEGGTLQKLQSDGQLEDITDKYR